MYVDKGKILWVDLTNAEVWEEEVPKRWRELFLGARGVNARLLWDHLTTDTDPLGPENLLIFGTGILTGTAVPSSGRITITCKSPATGLYLKTSAGGGFAAELRYSGYDFVVIKGRSSKPVYLLISDGRAEIRDASELWGKGVRETNRLLRRLLGDEEIRTAVIGQAGENLVAFAAIMFSVYNAAGRGGAGAVMGSKKLKAVVARGHGSIEVARPDEFYARVKALRDAIKRDDGARGLHEYGTSVSVQAVNEMGAFPCLNFQRGYLDDAYGLSGQALVERGCLRHRTACFACPIACHRYSRVEAGPYSGAHSGGPEYETFSALGGGCGSSNTEYVIKANELCNDYGLDTISTGSVIQWLLECAQRGIEVPGDACNMDLSWGNERTILQLIDKIAFREGVGDLLAHGVRRASEEVGQGSEAWAIQDRGLEQSRVDTRFCNSYALAFAVNPRGPDHLHAQPLAEFGGSEAARALIKTITGEDGFADPGSTRKRAEIVRWHEDVYAATEALGMCIFLSTGACYEATPEVMAGLASDALGVEMSPDELLETGRRTLTLERCFNIRQGADRRMDRAPIRLMTEPLSDRSGRLGLLSHEKLDRMLDEYYSKHGWDLATGWPTRACLSGLSLDDVADGLARIGINLKD